MWPLWSFSMTLHRAASSLLTSHPRTKCEEASPVAHGSAKLLHFVPESKPTSPILQRIWAAGTHKMPALGTENSKGVGHKAEE